MWSLSDTTRMIYGLYYETSIMPQQKEGPVNSVMNLIHECNALCLDPVNTWDAY